MEDERAFWAWFQQHEARFRSVDGPEQEQLLDELLGELHRYCDGLWFETGQADDGCNELIVSAEGNIEYFSAVRSLIAAAPSIDGWRFIAFKPACGFEFETNYEGLTLSPQATWFQPLRSAQNPSAFGLRVGYAHFEKAREQTFLAGTFTMLECALGELELAERVQHIEVVALPSSPASSGFLPIAELPSYLAE